MVGLQGTAEGDGVRERKRGLVFLFVLGGEEVAAKFRGGGTWMWM